ncbi:MAG: ABC transporter permease [Candidatus Humimicrobiaceae bacterium]
MIRNIKNKLIENRMQLSIFGVLLIVFAMFIIGNPKTFLSYNIYYAFMSIIPFTMILATSVTFVVALGEIDLSFPSITGFCAWVFTAAYGSSGNIYLAFLISLVVGLLAGALNGFIIVKTGIPAIIATIGTMYMWRGLVYISSNGIGSPLTGAKGTVLYKVLVGRIGGEVPAQAVWAIVIAILFALILNRHKFGAHVLFIGDNRESAKMMGVNVDRVRIIVFAQLGLFAAFVGVITCLEVLFFWTTTGEGYLMKTLSSLFIGGTSVYGGSATIFGSIIGSIIMGSLEAGIISAGFSGFLTQFLAGALIIVALIAYKYINKKSGLDRK